MYKVLLVDDERVILEGISTIIDWRSLGTELIGTARNGMEAKESIEHDRPDIVITDIKMPGMDGLQLVEAVKETDPAIQFIMLSGFGEFDYARSAMRYGVKHYLLKPCNENTIIQALQEVTRELERNRKRESFLLSMESELKRVMPHAKEQFLKELVTNKTYGRRDWHDFESLFRIPLDDQRVRLLLFQLEGDIEFEHIFALKNIAEDIMGETTLLLSTTIGKQVLLLIKDAEKTEWLYARIDTIKQTYTRFYKKDATAALSEPDEITAARRMYRETLECLEYRFYLGEGSLITRKDIAAPSNGENRTFIYDEEQLCLLVKSGRWDDVKRELCSVFESLAELRLDTVVAKSYLIPLYVGIIRQADSRHMNDYLKALVQMDELDTLQAIKTFIEAAAKDICAANFNMQSSKHSDMIGRMLDFIHENLANPQLSLHGMANEILYMNADYLGKLFKKEVGDKFSNYVTKLRMEKAMELIAQSDDVKVFELADRLGYGDNPQYFSQVFKKYTGFSPSEFKKAP